MADQTPTYKRYAIKNHRPGESFHTPGGFVTTHAIDGGARLTPAQKKYFEEGGESLIEVAAVPPEPPEVAVDERAAARIAENKAIAESQALEEQRVIVAAEETAANEQSGAAETVAAEAAAAAAATAEAEAAAAAEAEAAAANGKK